MKPSSSVESDRGMVSAAEWVRVGAMILQRVGVPEGAARQGAERIAEVLASHGSSFA